MREAGKFRDLVPTKLVPDISWHDEPDEPQGEYFQSDPLHVPPEYKGLAELSNSLSSLIFKIFIIHMFDFVAVNYFY